MCCNIKYVKKYITVKIINIDLINFERNFIGPSVPIKSKQNHATFGHSWNHNKDLAILCFYRYFIYSTTIQSIQFAKKRWLSLLLRRRTKIKGSFPGVCSEWQSAKINVHTAAAMVTMISRRYVLRDGWVPSVGLWSATYCMFNR